jgi:uncharacterized phage protein (predicted DNA packaging)
VGNVVGLGETKLHLRVTQDDEDALIQTYIEAAEEYISQFLNTQNFPDNSAIKAACLLTVSDLYENREGAGEKDIKENPAVMRLLYPYRVDIGI